MLKLDQLVTRLEADEACEPVSEIDVKLLGSLIKSFEQLSALSAKAHHKAQDRKDEQQSVDELRRTLAQRLTKLSQRDISSSVDEYPDKR